MTERAPAFQFYPRQFAGDDQVMGMDLEAIGAHILLMCAAASSPERCRIAADEYAMRMRLRNPSDDAWQRIKKQLLAGAWKLSEDGKWWIQSGLERTFQKQKEFSDQQRERANRKWNLNNTKSMPDSCRNDTAEMPETKPEVCSSSSSSSSKQNITSEPSGSDAGSLSPRKNRALPTEPGLRLARLLRQHILQNNPSAKVKESQVTTWAIEADRMMRRDERTAEQIMNLIQWSQSDSFWHKNILSMGTLRDKFDRLTLASRTKASVNPEDDDEPNDTPLVPPQWQGLADESTKGGRG